MYLDDINRNLLAFKIIYILFSLFLIFSLILYVSTNIYSSSLIEKRDKEIQFSDCLYLLLAVACTCLIFSILLINLNKTAYVFSIFNIILVSGLLGCIGYYYYLTYGINYVENYPGILILGLSAIILFCSILILFFEIKKRKLSEDMVELFKDAEPEKYEKAVNFSSEHGDLEKVARGTYETIKTFYPDYYKLNTCNFLIKHVGGKKYEKGDIIDINNVNNIYNQITQHYNCPIQDKKNLAYFLAKKYHSAKNPVNAAKTAVNNILDLAQRYKNVPF